MSDITNAAACLLIGDARHLNYRGFLLKRLARSGIFPDPNGLAWTDTTAEGGGRWWWNPEPEVAQAAADLLPTGCPP